MSELACKIKSAVAVEAISHRAAPWYELVTRTIPRPQVTNERPICCHCLSRDRRLVVCGLVRPNVSEMAARAAVHTA
jgi:hypothetical protein